MKEDVAHVVCTQWEDSWRATVISLHTSHEDATAVAKSSQRVVPVRFTMTEHRLPWPGLNVAILHDSAGPYVSAEPGRDHAVRGESPHRGFTACVAGRNCNPAAHGNITLDEICACGARRAVNMNQRFVERGPWRLP